MPQRPDLPQKHENSLIKSIDLAKLPPVKYQLLDRDGHEVLVGRMKIPTPSGHAFILRRFDTGAISLTTMFRAAFPTASELEEKKETNWVKESFELAGNNGSAKEPHIVRLAGTWVSPDIALMPEFAEMYHLADVIPHVAKASPDPSASYRRSTGKTTPKAVPRSSPVSTGAPLTPASSITMPTPKRRKESSPAPSPVPAPVNPPPPSMPPPRRSTRTKSPAPLPLPLPAVKSPKSARFSRSIRIMEVNAPERSDETVVEEEQETIDIAKPDMQQDIAEQKELIEKLKAQREVPQMALDPPAPLKRIREEEEEEQKLQFNFKEPEQQERQIATNSRVGRFHLEPRQKSFAWGVAAFAIGMGAM
ncbi:hypothetical protein BJ138DRAFT_1007362 [Hygrophoropsis aurantiaca]|uniref:Uncharacterized protein n=1 Tax=Hygrophoropsis aurantiaca TaxID=72124 RepID=A0ACB8AD00_9AGAM|nr:hypothetical protein BJ138DRAFT_1007362 [Hygrophoropsis aurantiaca]